MHRLKVGDGAGVGGVRGAHGRMAYVQGGGPERLEAVSDGDEQPGRLLSRVTEVPQRGPKPSEFLAPERHVELARRLRGAGADDHLGEGIRDVAVTLLDAEGSCPPRTRRTAGPRTGPRRRPGVGRRARGGVSGGRLAVGEAAGRGDARLPAGRLRSHVPRDALGVEDGARGGLAGEGGVARRRRGGSVRPPTRRGWSPLRRSGAQSPSRSRRKRRDSARRASRSTSRALRFSSSRVRAAILGVTGAGAGWREHPPASRGSRSRVAPRG